MKKKVTIKCLTKLQACELEHIRKIRNSPSVKRWMYQDAMITKSQHATWFEGVKESADFIASAVISGGDVLGLVSFSKINKHHGTADWAYYLSETSRGGLGAALEFAMIDYCFYELGLDKLNCEVIEGNDAVVKLHKKFFFKHEGFRESQIVKGGERLGVHFLGLEKVIWQTNRESLASKYAKIFNTYDINITW